MNSENDTRRRRHSLTALVAGAATLTAALASGPAASAQDDREKARQNDKNNMRNLRNGLGGVAILEALRGRSANALILGAGAIYGHKKYEDARKAQEREEAERDRRENRRYGYNEPNRYGTASSSSRRMTSNAVSAANLAPIDVFVNDERMSFTDQKPEMTAGNVYVPMRGVLEKLGANVMWDPQRRAVVATNADKTVVMPVNGQALVNGQPMTLETPAYIDNGRTMVPLRFLAETFGAQVAWDADQRDVRIDMDRNGA